MRAEGDRRGDEGAGKPRSFLRLVLREDDLGLQENLTKQLGGSLGKSALQGGRGRGSSKKIGPRGSGKRFDMEFWQNWLAGRLGDADRRCGASMGVAELDPR